MTKPLVAIVGRPNVGKSTLFNRLVGQRLAIVEDVPGTTRDRVYADASGWGHDFTVIDTGGLELRPESSLRQQVKRQAELAIDEADAIVLVVDVREGVTPADLEVADLLRTSGKPVVLAANKADSEQRQVEALEFYQMGLAEPVPVSAYHGLGIDRLLDKLIPLLPATLAEPETPGLMRTAIVGRPNVGKSLLLNAILGQERVIVDESPGTTRDAIDTRLDYEGQAVLLIDTAGIRRRGRVEPGLEHYSVLRALRAIDRADVALLVIDVSEGMTAQDLHIAGFVRQAFKGIVLVANKWDLIDGVSQQELSRDFSHKLRFMPHTPILFTSALTGQGVGQVVPTALQVYRERLKRIPTPQLSSVIEDAIASHPAPPVAGRRLKLYAVAQSEVNPPSFVFEVNDARLAHFSYQRYLENSIRSAFGFAGTPLRLMFKGRGKR